LPIWKGRGVTLSFQRDCIVNQIVLQPCLDLAQSEKSSISPAETILQFRLPVSPRSLPRYLIGGSDFQLEDRVLCCVDGCDNRCGRSHEGESASAVVVFGTQIERLLNHPTRVLGNYVSEENIYKIYLFGDRDPVFKSLNVSLSFIYAVF